jgi:hypothetical protein
MATQLLASRSLRSSSRAVPPSLPLPLMVRRSNSHVTFPLLRGTLGRYETEINDLRINPRREKERNDYMKTITLPIENSMNCSPSQHGLLPIMLLLAWFWASPTVQAVVPAPDGGYPNFNTAEGENALFSLTTGVFNTALGGQALFSNTNGNTNTAVGLNALFSNKGSQNVAVGGQALQSNTTGFQNAAIGWRALFMNTIGFHNTATGPEALLRNTTGNHNTATGDLALGSNTTGNFNTTDGAHSLVLNTTGTLNIVLGFAAGQNLTTGSNNIDVANGGVAAESNTIRIGNQVAFSDMDGIMHPAHTKTFIAGIHGVAVTGAAVVVSSSGQVGVAPSSARFKDEIKPMDKASEAILALKPVTFRYKKELDPEGIPQFGLVAEQVAKVNPDLVAHDAKGKPYTVRYEVVNAMLLNEFLKEHRKVQELEATVAQQHKGIEVLAAQLKEQALQIQKVSAQLELSTSTPQMAGNDR